ncbi:HNH endonuclease [Nitrosococcus wardiae]|uniref:HNH endonuclease n=1 Tax=Nitrosococcus wardiae TaxID=1814290 RepID=A0A4P7C3V3_9GAMM|nr:HNH endonuclease [Nitrosococcus wardiae]QBQ56284.1 HNH endonuclease [Nitrosococcus wardiae]
MDYLTLFRMPTPMKITGRSSSITNSFVNAIIPVVQPTAAEVKEALDVLGMAHDTYGCAFCGDTATEWDHLRPLVKGKKPTGYISEIHNLVPACGKCNQSKGNKEWESWMRSSARLSPKTRGVADLEERIEKLRAYELWGSPTQLDFVQIVGSDVWAEHWKNWQAIIELMKEAQVLAQKINRTVAKAHYRRSNTSIQPTFSAELRGHIAKGKCHGKEI